MKYTLKKPVTVANATVTEITIREEIVTGDLRGMKAADLDVTDNLALLISRLSGQSPAVIYALGLADFTAIKGIVGGFLLRAVGEASPTTTD